MFKLVISYNNRTKKCEAGPGIEDIEIEIKSKFSVNMPFHIQYLDKEVDEFIDLDSIDELSCNEFTKLRVITANVDAPVSTLNTSVDYQHDQSTTPTQTTSRPTTPSSISSLPSTSSLLDISDRPVTPPLPTLCSPSSRSSSAKIHVAEKTSPSTGSKRKLKQWPKMYTFPYHMIPISTRTKLENKQAITPKDRRDILTGIYQDLTSFEGGLYPTSERYNTVIDVIFREFPDIPHHEGLDASNSRDLWKERLRVKFQNSRKRVDGDLPEIVSKKKKKVENAEPIDLGRSSTTWGLANYLPEQQESEDETSIQSHITWLKKEHNKKESRDMEGVDRRMMLTLSHRRKLIIEESKSIDDMLIEYPWLGSLPELIKEFLRLGPKLKDMNITHSFDTNLKKYSRAVESLTKTRKTAKFANELRLRIKDFRSESERTYVESCCTVLGLPCLFREDITSIVKTDLEYQTCEEPARVAICYKTDILSVEKDDFKFIVEGVVVFKCSNFLKAMVGMMMAIYTFNLAYPKEVYKTLLLLQKVFLCLDDECSVDKRILNVMSLINQAM